MYDGGVRSQPQRSRLWYSRGHDAVEKKRKWSWRQVRCSRDIVRSVHVYLHNVDREEITAVIGEVVVDGETALRVERLWCSRLYNVQCHVRLLVTVVNSLAAINNY